MASNIEATKKGYECFQRGDIPSLIRDLLDDNCVWISPVPSDILPWAGTFKGKHEIANFFAQVGEHLEFSEFAPREMIEQGETVVVLGTLAGRAKKTGKTVKNEWAHVFKYSNGKVVFFQEYIDTAADVLAMSYDPSIA
jgi:ketosteroid isomerase-like protein